MGDVQAAYVQFKVVILFIKPFEVVIAIVIAIITA